jgi:glycine dehydrogenase subunit 2
MNNVGRPTRLVAGTGAVAETFTGNKALMLEEPLLFERGSLDTSGVDLPPVPPVPDRLGGLGRDAVIGLPGFSEPEAVRHYTRLSRQNYAIDLGIFPLGSCTMKHNPRLNEKMARLPGFADIHPLQPQSTVQGALELIDVLADWLMKLTGMPAVAMSPKAGAHGELCGMVAIRAALDAKNDPRRVVLVPESAHGTNPATAAFCGFTVENIPANDRGRVDLDAMLQLGDKQFLTTRADQGLTTQRAPRKFGWDWGWYSHQGFVLVYSDSFKGTMFPNSYLRKVCGALLIF